MMKYEIAFELEFTYYEDINKSKLRNLYPNIKNEKDEFSFEITTKPSLNIVEACDELNEIQKNILFYNGLFTTTPPCSLQINFSIEPYNYGILCNIAASFLYFIYEDIYYMFPHVTKLERLKIHNMNVPNMVCWGAKYNRTSLLRILTSSYNPDKKYIEYRLPDAAANVYLATNKLIANAEFAKEHKLFLPPQLFGNAYDKKYNLSKIL